MVAEKEQKPGKVSVSHLGLLKGTQKQLPQMLAGKMDWKPPVRDEIEDYCSLMTGYFRIYAQKELETKPIYFPNLDFAGRNSNWLAKWPGCLRVQTMLC